MFLKLRLSIRDYLKKTFHDEIIDIEEPREWWVEYKDVGRRLEGYVIPAIYKYRGKQNIYSTIDNDHFFIITKEHAFKSAWKFFNETKKKIAARNNENIK